MNAVIDFVSPDPVITNHHVQFSENGQTVWVHADDGSTVGRFDWRFGIDIHNTVTDQIAGAPQCRHCTHAPAKPQDWDDFRRRIATYFGIHVPAERPLEVAQVPEMDSLPPGCSFPAPVG